MFAETKDRFTIKNRHHKKVVRGEIMSFQEVPDSDQYLTQQPVNPPIFLLPGIDGNHIGLLPLARALKEAARTQGLQQQVYIFHDPRLLDPTIPGDMNYLSDVIHCEMQDLMREFQHHSGTQKVPFLLAGYSFGGPLAFLVAQKLEASNQSVSTCIIDAPTLALSREYLKPGNIAATRDLIAISNYVARLCNAPLLEFNDFEINQLAQYPIMNQIAQLESLIKTRSLSPDSAHAHFQVVKQNLVSLMSEPSSGLRNLDSLAVIATKETCDKYGVDISVCWGAQPHSATSRYFHATHTALIGKEHVSELASQLTSLFQERTLLDQVTNALARLTPTHQLRVLSQASARVGRQLVQQPPVFREALSCSPIRQPIDDSTATGPGPTQSRKRTKQETLSAYEPGGLTTFSSRPTRLADAVRDARLLSSRRTDPTRR